MHFALVRNPFRAIGELRINELPPTLISIAEDLQRLFVKNGKNTCETKKLRIYLQPYNCIMETRRDVFHAIADPTRRAIIALIALQAMTPNAIAENFKITRQAVSKHLRILTECELVRPEQQGREIYYSLQIEKMKEIDNWLSQYRNLWETRFNQLDNLLSTIKSQKK